MPSQNASLLAARMESVRRAMQDSTERPEAVVIASPENRRYLTGFSGSSAAAVLSASAAVLVTDFRYLDQARDECPGWEIHRQGDGLLEAVATVIAGLRVTRVGFERELATYGFYADLTARLEGCELLPLSGLVEGRREVKAEEEVDLIRQAAHITDAVLDKALPMLKPGAEEREIALEIEYEMRKLGADGAAFATIVASGARSALPHGRASAKKLAAGDLVTIDLGAAYAGYSADLTRTFVLGTPTARQKEIYSLVLEAQEAALGAVRPGRTGREVDAVARDIISSRGHGQHFGHGLGHGVGLAVHEGPRLAPTGEKQLVPGNVVTVEPGVYITDWGGVRIEDLCVVRPGGVEVLSRFPKELLVL